MALTLLLAFVAGIITILSPCVLPLLPLILGTATQADRFRPWTVILGFIATFTAATLLLSTLVRHLGVPPDLNRSVSASMLAAFGLVLAVPQFNLQFERWAGQVAALAPAGHREGRFAGLTVGMGLGLAWSPCVGPIMASVITLALNQQVGPGTVAVTLAFSLGTAIPMAAVLIGGRTLVRRLSWMQRHGRAIQAGFGIVLLATAASIWMGWDRMIQAMLLDSFPGWEAALIAWQGVG